MRRRALGLVEVLVASTALAVVALGLLAALRFAADSVAVASRQSAALEVAQNEMERLRVEAQVGSIPWGNRSISVALPNTGQNGTLATTATVVPGSNLLVDVVVTVTYPLPRSGTQTVTLATRMRNGGGP